MSSLQWEDLNKKAYWNILFIFCFVNRIDNKTAASCIKLLFFKLKKFLLRRLYGNYPQVFLL